MAPERAIQPLTLTEQVYQSLKTRIINHSLKPGSRLVVGSVAKEAGTSLTPVREALRLLERDGLVEMVPHKGAVIRKLSQKEFEDIFAVRAVLEGLAVKLSCSRLSHAEIESLENAMQSSKSSFLSGDVESWTEADEQFHKVIIQKSDNEFLKDMLASIFEHVRILWWLAGDLPGKMRKGINEHGAILAALKKRDADQAKQLIIEHIGRAQFSQFS